MRQEVLRLERVSREEQGVTLLDDFNLRILSGEIMGLLPANNLGLTALLNLLQRNTALRYGYVYYRGEQVNTWRTATRNRVNRIGLIQSEGSLAAGLTVADNVFVLRPGFKAWYIRPSLLEKQLLPFLRSIDIEIPANARVDELTAFEKTVVNILKSVVAGCKLITMRDISSFLNENELAKLHKLIKHYSEQGIAFLYIDFHLEELRQVCDKVALMSHGRIIKVLDSSDAISEVFRSYTLAYSGKVIKQISRHETSGLRETPLFEARNLSANNIQNLSFSVSSGECLVLQDVDNYIFSDLISILSGDTQLENGQILVNNRSLPVAASRDIAIIQELPSQTMLFNEMSYLDNLCFTLDHRLPEVWHNHRVRRGIRKEYSALLGGDIFDLRVDRLSKMQKYELVYSRIALQKPKIVFCVQPFRRADIELRMFIWDLLKMLLDKGIAVVILAVNLADSLSLANRLIRLERGRPSKEYLRGEFSTMPLTAPWVDVYREVDK